MDSERFLRAVDEVIASAGTAGEALRRAAAELHERRSVAVDLGVRAFVEQLMTGGGRELRLDAADAFRDYERAVATLRAQAVRVLVDEDGLTLTEVAAMLQVTRQTAARLYQHAAEGPAAAAN